MQLKEFSLLTTICIRLELSDDNGDEPRLLWDPDCVSAPKVCSLIQNLQSHTEREKKENLLCSNHRGSYVIKTNLTVFLQL